MLGGSTAAARAAALSEAVLTQRWSQHAGQLRFARTGRHRVTVRHRQVRHPPKYIVVEEARKMGEIDVNMVEKIAPRPVPTSARDYADRRREYEAELGTLRKQFKEEWSSRTSREGTAMQAIVEESERRAALRRARKDEHKALRAALHRKELAKSAAFKGDALQASARTQQLWEAQVSSRRAAWLDALEEDSAEWIPEDRIDELICEATFAEKYPWQYKSFFENAAAKRLDSETRRRMHVHQLTSPAVADAQGFVDAFPEDWQQEFDAEGAADRAAGAMAREALSSDLPVSAGGVVDADAGLRLEELYFGKSAAELKAEADAAMNEFLAPTAAAAGGVAASDAAADELDDVLAMLQAGQETSTSGVAAGGAGASTSVDTDWTTEVADEDDDVWADAFKEDK